MKLTTITDQAYGKLPRQRADIYQPEVPATTTIVFWHGGSWKRGDKKSYRFVGRALARLGYEVVIANYRLYPDVTFPAFIEDAALVVAWVQQRPTTGNVVVMGHSAGAHIAAVLALEPSYLEGAGARPIDGFVGLAGPYDFSPAQSLLPVFGGLPVEVWQPIHLVPGKNPPSLIVQGRIDAIVWAANAPRLARAIQDNGGKATLLMYPHLTHFTILVPFLVGWWTLPSLRRRLVEFTASL
jgi:acetyl esterase/lipase